MLFDLVLLIYMDIMVNYMTRKAQERHRTGVVLGRELRTASSKH